MKTSCVLLIFVLLGVWLCTEAGQRAAYRRRARPDSRWGRFEVESERCSEPMVRGPCRGYFRSWYHDATDQTCKSFVYGGCGGNENRFWSRSQCEDACVTTGRDSLDPSVCNLAASVGHCRGFITRYYYNRSMGRCTTFHYGGCGGNGNNFSTLDACQNACATRGDTELWDF